MNLAGWFEFLAFFFRNGRFGGWVVKSVSLYSQLCLGGRFVIVLLVLDDFLEFPKLDFFELV